MDMSDIWTGLGQIVLILLFGGVLLVLEYLRQKATDWYRYRKLHPIARSVLANRKVHTLLVELRTRTDADRAYIYLFHNGQVFSNKNPLWRMSCTQETCRQGISHEIDHRQSVLASTVWDGLAPFFGDIKDIGDGCQEINMHKNKVYVFTVHDMTDSYWKRALVAHGVKYKIASPIIDHRNEIVGLVAIDFCTEETINKEQVAEHMSEASGAIHYALTEE